MLEGFKPIELMSGSAVLSVTSNGLSFNKNVISKMMAPEYIRFMVNAETKQLAIQTVSKDIAFSVPFAKKGIDNKNGIRYNNRDLEHSIESLMDWDLSTKVYRIDGIYHEEDHAMIFNLTTARMFPKRTRAGK